MYVCVCVCVCVSVCVCVAKSHLVIFRQFPSLSRQNFTPQSTVAAFRRILRGFGKEEIFEAECQIFFPFLGESMKSFFFSTNCDYSRQNILPKSKRRLCSVSNYLGSPNTQNRTCTTSLRIN